MRNALLALASALVLLAVCYRWSREPREKSREPQATVPAHAQVSGRVDAGAHVPRSVRPAALDAAQLTARARQQLERDPAAALQDITRADQQDGTNDEERRALEIAALVRLGRVGHARALAEAFYRTYPGSTEGAALERLTGSHPHPHGP